MEALFGQFWDKTILRQGMSHGNKDEGLSTKLRDIIDLKNPSNEISCGNFSHYRSPIVSDYLVK